MTENKKILRVSPEVHKKLKAIAVLKEMKLYEITQDILEVYTKEILKQCLEEMLNDR